MACFTLGLLSSFTAQCYILTTRLDWPAAISIHITMTFAILGKCCLKMKNVPVVKTLVLLVVAEVSVVTSIMNDIKEAQVSR